MQNPWEKIFLSLMLLWCSLTMAHPGGVDRNGCHVDRGTQQRHCHPERVAKVRRSLPPRAGDEGVFNGPFIDAADGDSFRAKIQGVVMEFRLKDIDAPESDQPWGAKAKEELLALLRGKQVVIVFEDVDRYGRTIGDAWVGDLHVNREMVVRGAAWFYAQYADDDALYRIEQQARDAKRGLWSLPIKQRLEPWLWREQKRQRSSEASR